MLGLHIITQFVCVHENNANTVVVSSWMTLTFQLNFVPLINRSNLYEPSDVILTSEVVTQTSRFLIYEVACLGK
jgi:hypothetical protein